MNFGWSVASARWQQFKQAMTGMGAVSCDVLCPAKIACRGNILQRWQLPANDFLCRSHHSLQSFFVSRRAACIPHCYTVGQNRLDCCMIKADEQSPVHITIYHDYIDTMEFLKTLSQTVDHSSYQRYGKPFFALLDVTVSLSSGYHPSKRRGRSMRLGASCEPSAMATRTLGTSS